MNRPAHILMMSDHLIDQKIVEGLLTRMGHAYSMASSVEMAMHWLENKKFDCIFLGSSGGESSVCQLAREVRQGDFFIHRQTPLILLSSSFPLTQARTYLDVGINDFLLKPIKFRRLSEKLDQWRALKNRNQLSFQEALYWAQVFLSDIREHLKREEFLWVAPKVRTLGQLTSRFAPLKDILDSSEEFCDELDKACAVEKERALRDLESKFSLEMAKLYDNKKSAA